VLIVLVGSTARAWEEPRCRAIAGGSDELAQHAAIDRLLWVQRRLDHEAWKARVYTWTFLGAYAGLIAGNGANLILHHANYGQKVDNGVAVGGSAFGLVVMAINPPAVLRDQHRLAKVVSSYDVSHACATLAAAERILLHDASAERFGRSALVHMGNLGFNFALGAVIGAVLHRWDTGLIVGPAAAAAGELQILSMPTRINATLEQYRLGDLRERPSARTLSWALSPQIGSGQVGIGGGIAF